MNNGLNTENPDAENLVDILKSIAPPEMEENSWIRLENKLFAELKTGKPSRVSLRDRPVFSFFLFKPVFAAALLLAIGAAALFTLARRAPAPEPLANARVVQMQGSAEFIPAADKEITEGWTALKTLQAVPEKAGYRVSGNDYLSIQLDAGTCVKLCENGVLMVDELKPSCISLSLENGSLLVAVSSRAKGQTFTVSTPNAVCSVVGTRFKVEVQAAPAGKPSSTLLTVMEGKVRFTGRNEAGPGVMVLAGEAALRKGETTESPAPSTRVSELLLETARLAPAAPSAAEVARLAGILSVTSEPAGAEVIVNGRIEGRTPLMLEQPVGPSRVALQSPGFASVEQRIEVKPQALGALHLTMERIKALKLFKGLIEQETALPVLPAISTERAQTGPEADVLSSGIYQLALDMMEKGETVQAVALLDELLADKDTPAETRVKIMEKKAGCSRILGDFTGCVSTLMAIYNATPSPVKRDNLLWEIASIKASNLGQYREAAGDLQNYIATFKKGVWIQEANIKLAEIQYLLKQPEAATATYSAFIKAYPESPLLDKALYNVAYIQGHDLKDCASANQCYNRLESDFTGSPYLQDAVFWHADCLVQLGQIDKARDKYRLYLKNFPDGRWRDAAMERISEK
jgi:tetratricopeptide (TPR) repeat protein